MADFFTMPGALTSQLDAVNALISTIGQLPVTTIDPPPTSDVDLALARLNEVDLEVQSRGWFWNSEENYPITLDGSGLANLPDETLDVRRAYGSINGTLSSEIVQRGTKLYDKTNHTYVFAHPGKVYVDLVVRLGWDLLPQTARSYITLLAAQRFHARRQQSQVVLQVNAGDIRTAMVTLEQREDSDRQNNAIKGNVGAVSAIWGIGGMRRNRGGL